MSHRVSRSFKNPRASLYHDRLIKILIVIEQDIRNEIWDDFLMRNGFITVIEELRTQPLMNCVRQIKPQKKIKWLRGDYIMRTKNRMIKRFKKRRQDFIVHEENVKGENQDWEKL